MIEASYIKYTNNEDPSYRTVIIKGKNGTYTLDFEYMIQYNSDDTNKQRKIRRIINDDDSVRPSKSLRFIGDIEMISGS
jgi:hypothetical protein